MTRHRKTHLLRLTSVGMVYVTDLNKYQPVIRCANIDDGGRPCTLVVSPQAARDMARTLIDYADRTEMPRVGRRQLIGEHVPVEPDE